MRSSPRTDLLAVAAAVLAGCLLSTPADAQTVYQWVTDEGTWAFADDEKKVPDRYRDRVTTRTLRALRDYERFTGATTPEVRPPALPAVGAPPPGWQPAAPEAAPAPALSIRTGGPHSPVIDVTPTEDAPIVIEKRRYLPDGGAVTGTATIVRQGDRILTIIKPQVNEINVTDIADEDELE